MSRPTWLPARLVRTRAVLIALTMCLAALVAIGAPGTAFLRWIAGPANHVCHCTVAPGHDAHAGCGCPICVPELREDDAFGAPELIGQCGDDEPTSRASSMPAVASAAFVIARPEVRAAAPVPVRLETTQWSKTPEVPPPLDRLSVS